MLHHDKMNDRTLCVVHREEIFTPQHQKRADLHQPAECSSAPFSKHHQQAELLVSEFSNTQLCEAEQAQRQRQPQLRQW